MKLEEIFSDKSIKAKAKVAQIGEWLLDKSLKSDKLLSFADKQIATNKATCIEAIEFATKKNPKLLSEKDFLYIINALKEEEPRIKWESAKVIANTAQLFPDKLKVAITNLLKNSEDEGTVVRWATATALSEILKLKTEHNAKLISTVEALCEKEKDNGVKKKYLYALKKVKK